MRFAHRFVFALTAICMASGPAAAVQSRAYVACTDFSTGALSWVDLGTRVVTQDVRSLSSDPVIRYYDGLIYVVNRFGADNIQVIDPNQAFATVRQISTGNGTNPQDIVFASPTKAYVSRYNSADLLIVNPSSPSGQPMASISLAGFADSDGFPEMARMFRLGRFLFVACQRLTNFQASNPSVVVVVDTEADTVVDVNPGTPVRDAIALAKRNPATTFDLDRDTGHLVIGCAGDFGATDGGIEAIDPVDFQSLGVLIEESQLGGDVSDVVWRGPLRSFAIVNDAAFNTCLIAWNPTSGMKLGNVYCPGGFSLADAELNDRDELWVCNNGFATPGLFVFDAESQAQLAGPLSTGLPPFSLTFDAETGQVTGVAGQPSSLELAGPWPNPAGVAARIALRLAESEEVRIEVFDLAGRRVREIARGPRGPGNTEIVWDLRDSRNIAVAPGVYLLRVASGPKRVIRRLVVAR